MFVNQKLKSHLDGTVITKSHTTIAGETSGKTEAYQGGNEALSPCMEFLRCLPAHIIQFEILHKLNPLNVKLIQIKKIINLWTVQKSYNLNKKNFLPKEFDLDPIVGNMNRP